jgi:RNA polymerase sigma-70 factor (ECF subfamily)
MVQDFAGQVAAKRPLLVKFSTNFTYDRDEAQDLVQETLLKAIQFKNSFRQNTNLEGWLFIIMRNTYINKYRKQVKAKSLISARELSSVRVEDHHTFTRPLEALQVKEVWRVIDRIREEFQVPLKMFITGYKYEEIASNLKIPVGTVKNRIFQARQEVQKRLPGYVVNAS